LTIIPTS